MKNGQQVLVLGNISVYERDGHISAYMHPGFWLDGAGLLWEKPPEGTESTIRRDGDV